MIDKQAQELTQDSASSGDGQRDHSSKLVLIIEDEASLVASLAYSLRQNGYRVMSSPDGVEGLDLARRERPDAILLDLMLPRMDGLDVCRRVRADSDVPILMLTAKAEETDIVVGLEAGADDYITKPFSLRELIARLRGLIRRSEVQELTHEIPKIVIGHIEIDERGRTVRRSGQVVNMKPKEFDLLYCLASSAGQVLTRAQLLERVWGYDFYGSSRTIDVHVRWLREKLEVDAGRPAHLLTMRGIGYKFVR